MLNAVEQIRAFHLRVVGHAQPAGGRGLQRGDDDVVLRPELIAVSVQRFSEFFPIADKIPFVLACVEGIQQIPRRLFPLGIPAEKDTVARLLTVIGRKPAQRAVRHSRGGIADRDGCFGRRKTAAVGKIGAVVGRNQLRAVGGGKRTLGVALAEDVLLAGNLADAVRLTDAEVVVKRRPFLEQRRIPIALRFFLVRRRNHPPADEALCVVGADELAAAETAVRVPYDDPFPLQIGQEGAASDVGQHRTDKRVRIRRFRPCRQQCQIGFVLFVVRRSEIGKLVAERMRLRSAGAAGRFLGRGDDRAAVLLCNGGGAEKLPFIGERDFKLRVLKDVRNGRERLRAVVSVIKNVFCLTQHLIGAVGRLQDAHFSPPPLPKALPDTDSAPARRA